MGGHDANGDQAVYRRGVPTSFAALVVTGGVKVFAGQEKFESIHGPWSLLGKRCLELNCEGSASAAPPTELNCKEGSAVVPIEAQRCTYKPDFTAYTEEAKDGATGTRLLIIPAEAHLRLLQRA